MRPKAKRIETPEQKVERWYRGQDRSLSDDARENWQAGSEMPVTIGDEHYERFFSEDESSYVVVSWTDVNGLETIG